MPGNADVVAAHAREHAWKYFELHANQRITVFNFFLVLSGALIAGMAAALQASPRLAALGIGLGMLLSLASFVFWKLDQRVSFLIKHAERALSFVEGEFPLPEVQLFQYEPAKTVDALSQASFWTRMWTYGKVFRLIFGVMAIAGIVGLSLCALRASGNLQWDKPRTEQAE